MHTNHLIRGGLLTLGTGIFAMALTASTGAITPSAASAPVATGAEAARAADVEAVEQLPLAPAATPVLVEVEVDAVDPVVQETDPAPEPEPDYPVVQAGPGPATPVEGAITLIDPLVIER